MPPRSSTQVYTLGVEEEYPIIDPVTRDLSSTLMQLLPEASKTLGEAVQPELLLSQIEVATPVCQTLNEVRKNLKRLRGGLIAAADTIGVKIAATATHPFGRWQDQELTPEDRYLSLQQNYQYLTREQSIFACHVHVGMDNQEDAIQVMNHVRGWLPLLLALTGNSPFLNGVDTGYQSFRTELWARWPFSGPPNYFSSLAEYEKLIQTLTIPGTIDDARGVYWDMRLSARFKTIEVRIVDVCLTIEETVMVAGLVRALIQTCHELVRQEEPAIPFRPEVLRVTSWQAARYGLGANLLNPLSEQIVPARQLLEKFLDFIKPALQKQGDWETVSKTVEFILQEGTGASRQRAIFQQTGSLRDVVDFIVQQTASEVG